MKPFLGIDLTIDKKNEQLNGNEFLIQEPSFALSNHLETSMKNADETIANSKLPFPLRIIKHLCGIMALLIIISILRADVTIAEAYQNAPGLFWVAPICAIIWLLLFISSYFKSKTVLETDESTQIFSHLDSISNEIYTELSVPFDAKEVDILLFFYKEKNGNIKVTTRGMQITEYFNPVFKIFTDNEHLYLANLDGKYAFPLSSIVKMHTIKKRIRIEEWHKEEQCTKGIYKPYKLTTDNYGCVICKYYHILEINHQGNSWGIYIPCYELPIFEEIININMNY